MAKEKKYKVMGKFEGRSIDETVSAYSIKQAKLRAGFKSGFGGRDMMRKITRTKSVKARMVK